MASNTVLLSQNGTTYKLICKFGSFTYYRHLYSVLVRMREITEQEKGMVFCQGSGVGKIPQLIADVLHCCSLHMRTHTHTHWSATIQKPLFENVFKTAWVQQEKWYVKRWLTGGTLSLLKTSVMRPQLLSKCPLLGWHLVDACGGEGPATEQTPHWWQGGEKHVR